jgi:hypothetical protein
MRWTAAVVATLFALLLVRPPQALADDRAELRLEAPGLEGADLFIDGHRQGELPATVSLTAGSHRFSLRPPRGDALMLVAEVAVQGELALSARLDGLLGAGETGPSLRIAAVDPGRSLQVVAGDQSLGRTPVDIPLAGQQGPLAVFADNGALLQIELQAAGTLPGSDAPEPAAKNPASGKVTLHCDALKGAHVVVDGEPAGTLPLSLTLTEGRHRFFIEPPDGEPFTMERDIEFMAPGMGVTIMLEPPR